MPWYPSASSRIRVSGTGDADERDFDGREFTAAV